MKALLAFAFAALFAVESFGVDAVWKNTSTADQTWWTASNWKDSTTGEELTEPPTNATDTATFPDIDTTTRTVKLSAKADGWSGNLASVTGGEYWRLQFNALGDGAYRDFTETFSFGDVNGFKGEWRAVGGKKTLRLAAESGTQTLPVVSVAGQFSVDVANADTVADILTIKGTSGSLKKSGAGDLRVREIADGGDLVLELESGNIQLDGKMKDPLAAARALAAKSAVWLDASARDTWERYSFTDDKGRTRVTNWVDAAGRDVKAEIWDNSGDSTDSHIKDIQPPLISARTSSTGLPLMDFGTNSTSSTDLPQALMRLTGGAVRVQEAVYIAEVDSGYCVFGDTTDYSFSAAQDYVFTYGESITNNGGFAFFNGGHKTPALVKVGSIWRMPRQTDVYSPMKKNSLQLTDVCFGEGNAKPVRYLASDRVYKSNSGGVRIGEAMLFTTKLTDAERKVLTEYLMGKWFAKYNHKDFDVANVADGTSITVPEGRIARISTLRATGTTFTKKGAGTLELGRVYPEGLTITVEGGEVNLETVIRGGEPTAPAGTPQLWFDANATDVFVTEGDGVTAWKDCRGNGKQATRLDFKQITAYPAADTMRVPGKTTLTFPDKAAFAMPIGDGVREAFIAFCYTDSPGQYNVIGEGYKTDRGQGGVNYMFAAPGVGLEVLAGGTFSVDGRPVRPFERARTTFVQDGWCVVHLSTTALASLGRLASNGPRSQIGHVSYGEVVTYDTPLSPEDRAATIDYLMRKWTGKRHPEYAKPAADVSLAFDGDATIGGGTDVTFAEVTGSGSLTKVDAGDATVTAELTEDFADIAVQGGSLTITKIAEPPDRSVFHFDAMDTASFTDYFIDENGETNIVRWADTRANGVYAYKPGPVNPSGANWMYMTNPIVRHVTFPDGKVRPVLDFLKANSRNVEPTGAGLYLSNVDSVARKIKEAHYIFGNGQSRLRVFHGRYDSDFLRGSYNQLFRNGAQSSPVSADIQNGYISVNNAPADSTYVLRDDNFYLVSIAPLAAKDISAIGVDRADQAGGDRFGECIAFTDYLPDKERAYLQTKLMHKWLGGPEAVWTNELESVSVAKDATLTVSGGAIRTPTVTGGGTIEATRVMGIAALNLKATDRTTVEGLTVEGVADFAGAVSVNLSGADAAKLKPGKYALVTATSFANLDLAQWSLSTQLKYACRFVQEADTVFLEVQPNGMLLLVR